MIQGHNLHGRPGRIIYIFNADTKRLHSTASKASDAAKVIQKKENGIWRYIKYSMVVNGFILSHENELMERHELKFI